MASRGKKGLRPEDSSAWWINTGSLLMVPYSLDYGRDGRLDHRLTVLSTVMHIKQQAAKLRREAYRGRRQRVNEETWRWSTENFITSRFKAEVVCRKCRKRFWEADFQAVQTEWAIAAKDLRERRAKRLPCTCSNEERMLVDMRHESHYKRGHRNNRGAKVAGKIELDMTFLRTEGHIQPIKPDNPLGRRHYRVEYDLVLIVDGYNIAYEARWDNGQGEHVLAEKQNNIAAAFASLRSEVESEDDENEYPSD